MQKNNRKYLILLLVPVCMLLTSCSRSSQVENQAYVLVMGFDQTEDEQLQLSVKVPKISGGGSGGSSGGQNSSGGYTQLSITGENFEDALEKLDWAVPRDLNLSHLKLIVLSRKMAESDKCAELIENIAQTERLFTSARVVVCEGSAKDFINAMQPVIGTRISTDIDALFEHYTSNGYVPESSLAELFYRTKSVYSDPMITYAILDKKAEKNGGESESAKPASALSGSVRDISSDDESEIANRYLGAAVFSKGRFCGVLNGTQTIIANLLRNDVDSFRFNYDNQSLGIVPSRRAFVSVETDEGTAKIHIDAKLSISAQERKPNEEGLKKMLTDEIRNTIEAARAMGAEPFGFAERAARNFATLEEWTDYRWKDRFKDAEIEIDLSFAYSDT